MELTRSIFEKESFLFRLPHRVAWHPVRGFMYAQRGADEGLCVSKDWRHAVKLFGSYECSGCGGAEVGRCIGFGSRKIFRVATVCLERYWEAIELEGRRIHARNIRKRRRSENSKRKDAK